MALSRAMDMVSRDLAHHHQQVGYASYKIAKALGLSPDECGTILVAGAVHDIGALPIVNTLDDLVFEHVDQNIHARLGAELLDHYRPFKPVTDLVKYHHISCGEAEKASQAIPVGAFIVHLADNISRRCNPAVFILDQRTAITDGIRGESGVLYPAEVVEAFLEAASREAFWLDLTNGELSAILLKHLSRRSHHDDSDDLEGLASLFSTIIDYRSRFTATHSSGVSATSGALACAAGFGELDCIKMRIAGHLHDVGKLAVPRAILEKPGKLDVHEFNIIKSHTYWTCNILEEIPGIETINSWASLHHERLDGRGYPYHLGEGKLTLGSRIMAVADVFTAITEDRPYRPGMDIATATGVIEDMVRNGALDGDVYEQLKDNIQDINQHRINAQSISRRNYQDLFREFD